MGTQQAILEIQRHMFEEHGIRTHVHYKEGYGMLAVREEHLLAPQHVIAAIDEDGIHRIATEIRDRKERMGYANRY